MITLHAPILQAYLTNHTMTRFITLLMSTFLGSLFSNVLIAQAPIIDWQRSFGGSAYDELIVVKATHDGGYIMAGHTESNDGDITTNAGNSDCWVVKTNANGDIEWQKTYGGSGYDNIVDIIPTTGGGYIFCALSSSNDGQLTMNYGSDDVWIVKLNSAGNIQWQRSYGGSSHDNCRSIIQTLDGGYAMAGYTLSNDNDLSLNQGQGDVWVLKITSTGNVQWSETFGGSGYDVGECIIQNSDGSYIIVASTDSEDGDVTGSHGFGEAWIFKLNSNGGPMWSKTLGGSGFDGLYGATITADGGYAFIGYAESNDGDLAGHNPVGGDLWLVKTDAFGEIQWQKTYGGSDFEDAYTIHPTDDGYIITGYTASNDGDFSGNHGDIDYLVFKVNNTGDMQWHKCIGGPEEDFSFSSALTTDGGIILTGGSNSDGGDVTGGHGYFDGWVVKLSGTVSMDEEPTTHINTTSIYPNPAAAHITLSNIARGAVITIHDSNGKLMHEAVVNETQAIINTTQYASGVYMVQVKHGNTKETHRLVID